MILAVAMQLDAQALTRARHHHRKSVPAPHGGAGGGLGLLPGTVIAPRIAHAAVDGQDFKIKTQLTKLKVRNYGYINAKRRTFRSCSIDDRKNLFMQKVKTIEEQRMADRKEVADRKNRFYSTKPENLNYLDELAALKEIKQKYEVING